MTTETVPNDILLQVTGLSKHFGGLPALAEVSFSGRPGARSPRSIGPNGAGKTTLFNCLTGVIRPDAGAIRFDGADIAGLPAHRVARLGISRTFQNLRIFPRLTVLDNVLCGLTVRAGASMLEALLRLPALRHRERRLKLTALEALDTFGLADKAGLPAGVLPYGSKKRVEMARAFVSQPVADPAGRTGGGPQPRGDRASRRPHPPDAPGGQNHGLGGARHGAGHGGVRPRGGPGRRQPHRPGRPRRRARTTPWSLEAYLGRMSATA